MIVSFVAAVDFIFSFTPPNPATYVDGKTPVLPYIAATTNPNIYTWLAFISFLIGILSLLLLVIPKMKGLIISRVRNNSIVLEKANSEEEKFMFEPQEIQKFIEFIYYQLVSQNKKKLASKLRQYIDAFYIPSSEDLGKLQVVLDKILNCEDISFDDKTKNRIMGLINVEIPTFNSKN